MSRVAQVGCVTDVVLCVLDSALQIFSRESHPSVYKAGSSNSTKEGLSLFGNYLHTPSWSKCWAWCAGHRYDQTLNQTVLASFHKKVFRRV